MKRTILMLIILIFVPDFIYAGDFLSVKVIPGSRVISESKGKLEYKTGLSHDEALAFYRNPANLDQKDVNYRDWSKATYIEDDSNKPWHSIQISKKSENQETTIIISKDSWSWITGTLTLRFVGVFIVLLILYVGMKVSGLIISKSVAKTA